MGQEPVPVPVPTNNAIPSLQPWELAALRFLSILVILAVSLAIITFVPDPSLKTVGVGLAIAALGALEQYVKAKGLI